ncbi:hypothetical protein RIF29_28852 [Crotalaria pallida]|uniref:Uncharacterized protein n=1 Tax=Crotalaria pallida TaxID=3830 RepID=A0AAN9HVE0_CROPI
MVCVCVRWRACERVALDTGAVVVGLGATLGAPEDEAGAALGARKAGASFGAPDAETCPGFGAPDAEASAEAGACIGAPDAETGLPLFFPTWCLRRWLI